MNTSENKPYIFISYAHADSERVMPAISALQNSRVNLWYDNGIVAGSEWPEFIAEKVMNCTSFVLFVSKAYLESQNCKRELNFAISRKKNILSIFLEEVELSPGVEMQLGSYQAIFRNRFFSDKEFHSSLSAESFFNNCRVGIGETVETPETKQTAGFRTGYRSDAVNTPDHNGNASGDDRFSSIKKLFSKSSSAAAQPAAKKNKYVAAVLAIFLGSFGANYFYLGSFLWGILSIVLYWSAVPLLFNLVLGFRYIFMTDENFQRKAARKARPWEYFFK